MTCLDIMAEGVHFNRPFGDYGWTMSWAFQDISCSSLSTFWLLCHLSWSLSWQEIKRRNLCKAADYLHRQQKMAKQTASWLEAILRAGTSPTIVSHHYRLVSHCVLWNIPARCMRIRVYQTFLLLRPTGIWKGFICFKRSIHTYTSPAAQIIQTLITSI